MSLDVLRQSALQAKQHEIATVSASHTALGVQLRAITTLITSNEGLHSLRIFSSSASNDSETPTLITSSRSASADASNKCGLLTTATSGHHFDESTLPFPHIPQYDAAIYASSPNRSPSHPSQPAQTPAGVDGLATEAAVTDSADVTTHTATATVEGPSTTLLNGTDDPMPTKTELPSVAPPDSAVVAPAKVVPPCVSEEAEFSAATKELLNLDSPQRPAKTVHLPSEAVQLDHKRERDDTREDRRQSESEKATRPAHLHAQTELASSPSSTIGPYSAATPLPPQESPDTSPNSENAESDVLPPKDLRPTSEERQANEERARLFTAQKEIARKEAFGSEATPDDLLRWEAREAAAREASENAALESVRVSESRAKRAIEGNEVDEVMEDVQVARVTEPISPASTQGGRPMTESTMVPQRQPPLVADDDENITVVPRAKHRHAVDTSRRRSSAVAPGPPRMTPRASFGATTSDSLAGLSGATPVQSTEPQHLRAPLQALSQETTLPTSRHPQGPAHVNSAVDLQQRRGSRPISRQLLRENLLSLTDLTPLKGLAEDSDRDYLEPLFRMQAHDSPQNKWTKPLPELVKVAHKYLSTDDQFATLHERMDYRILRRIYHLQNANKWSLRQMERVKEPEQPVTHMDHMMREMKWMCKDFKAERKMKKSVCAWLAVRCREFVAANDDEKEALRSKGSRKEALARSKLAKGPPSELERQDRSAFTSEVSVTPSRNDDNDFPANLIVVPELTQLVCNLKRTGTLGKALRSLPVVGFTTSSRQAVRPQSLVSVSKFVGGKVLPRAAGPIRKRSRYDYEDDAELLESPTANKRFREERDLEPEEQEVALFHPDNKHIRDRLHANNAFRPPSEFAMPSTPFYEWRNGSQWIWEDDQKLRKLAKEYSFNWSLIADEMTLPSRYKSSAERRTPWECFERWVELETLPAEMRKTVYFKTWFQRLEQSQQAVERRHQAQVAAMHSQAQQNGQQAHTPQRRRTNPTRVEKRKTTRYLWLVDAMRKHARKRENNAYKQAEAQRAAAQRKSQNENTTQQRGPMLTPQEFSKRRHERDLQVVEAQRQHRQKMIEAQQRQMQMARAAQQGAPNGLAIHQRPGTANVPPQNAQMQVNGQQNANMNGQLPQQARPPLPMATRNGHLAVPQVNAQGIPQAQMRPGSHQDMQRFAQANAQRSAQYPNQQPYHLPSPGGGMTTQQQLQNNQQLLAQLSAQQQQQQSQGNNGLLGQGTPHAAGGHPLSGSPSMPPPPTPHALSQQPGQLSSGHVPALMIIKNQLRQKHPHLSDDQLNQAATSALREQSQSQSSNQARQSAMNAAAGIPAQAHAGNMQAFAHNQAAFQNNGAMPNGNTAYMNGDGINGQSPNLNGASQQSPQAAAYASQMRQRQMQMMRMQQSPGTAHAQLSPSMVQGSPNMTPASPSMPYSQTATMGGRPPSRSNTPQMQRMGSSNSVPGVGMASGMQSPSALPQGSPRNMQASMAR